MIEVAGPDDGQDGPGLPILPPPRKLEPLVCQIAAVPSSFCHSDNPYNVGMTGMIGGPAGYHAVLDCDVLLLLGQILPGVSSIQIELQLSRSISIRPI
jgi:hypothetical protein